MLGSTLGKTPGQGAGRSEHSRMGKGGDSNCQALQQRPQLILREAWDWVTLQSYHTTFRQVVRPSCASLSNPWRGTGAAVFTGVNSSGASVGGCRPPTPVGLGKGFCPASVWVSPPPTTGNIAVPTSARYWNGPVHSTCGASIAPWFPRRGARTGFLGPSVRTAFRQWR